MPEYIYATVALVFVVALWDCLRRWIAHRERIAFGKESDALSKLTADLAATKASLADVITTINLSKLQNASLLRRVGNKQV